jgi:hypothetical protein
MQSQPTSNDSLFLIFKSHFRLGVIDHVYNSGYVVGI